MGYSKQIIEIKEVKEIENLVGTYSHALVYMMSNVYLGIMKESVINWAEVLEARFFSTKEELHVFRFEKEWRAVITTDTEEADEALVKRYLLSNRFREAGTELLVKEYLAEDEDGQVYTELTRLCGIV